MGAKKVFEMVEDGIKKYRELSIGNFKIVSSEDSFPNMTKTAKRFLKEHKEIFKEAERRKALGID